MIKQRLKSKTHRFNTFVGAVGILEVNFHYLQNLLGEYYGLSFIGIMVVGYALRELTTKPVSEK